MLPERKERGKRQQVMKSKSARRKSKWAPVLGNVHQSLVVFNSDLVMDNLYSSQNGPKILLDSCSSLFY